MNVRSMIGFSAVTLMLAGCALPPEGTSPGDVTRFEAAAATVGCQMRTEADYLPVELQTGLTRTQTTQMAAYMVATNRAVRLETGGIRLISGPCQTGS